MSMKTRRDNSQNTLWIATTEIQESPGHPFYRRLNELLKKAGFDKFAENNCKEFYAENGRPSIPPGNYFRMLMIGYFEGISSERGIEWRCADSLSLREFLGLPLSDRVPDHSSLSRIRHRLPLNVHIEIFKYVLRLLAENRLLKGENIGIDATTLEANAAMRSIVRRDTGESYNEFLEGLAKASGIETPTKSDLIKVDKTRKNKASNNDWQSPSDPDAGITKMKNGSTHLAHKAEHAVDLDTDAIVAINVYPGHAGDTATGPETLEITVGTIEQLHEKSETDESRQVKKLAADKGYHSDDVLKTVGDFEVESYIASKDVTRNFEGKPAEKKRYQANERRLKTKAGKSLFKLRSGKTERSMAHMYLTGGLRRCWLRGHGNIIKRLMIHAVSFNLGLIMRKALGCGTPRGLAEKLSQTISEFLRFIAGNFGRITLRFYSLAFNS